MWEWSKTSLNPSKELSLYKAIEHSQFSEAQNIKHIPSPEEMKNILFKKMEILNLKNLKLKECTYHPHTWEEMNKDTAEYQRIRKTFLKLIGYSYEEDCRNMGFDDEDIKLLRSKKSPENYNTHIKIPLDFGGKLNFQNLSLVKSHPCHDNIHSLIEMQIGNRFLQKYKIIFIPWFEGMFYYD